MINTKLEKLLKRVEKPGRYIGGEINSVIKPLENIECRFAFAFPDTYEIGMSCLGMEILYNIMNKQATTYCERVFAPAIDMEELMRKEGIELFSLETKSSIKDFDILGFTLQYEMCYTNILNMLELSNIPLLARDRDDGYPIVVAGGPCAFNPEPLCDFIDLFSIGDGEDVMIELTELYKKTSSKEEFLTKASKIRGVYVPKYYDIVYNDDGTIKEFMKKREEIALPIKRCILSDLNSAVFPIDKIVPLINVVHDRATVETFRGCTRGCRFCQAGIIYRPVRERKKETILNLAKEQIANTGHEELSLLSLSTSDYSEFEELAKALLDECINNDVSLSLPSLRLDSFSFNVLNEIQKYRKSGLTFAPEAGTQRLRDVINKTITEKHIYTATRKALELGWKQIKLYFMIGHPTETEEDLDGIANIAKNIIDINYEVNDNRGGRFNLTVSVSNFVPKPHTPFQWHPQDTREEFSRKHRYLKDKLKIKGVTFNYHDSPTSTLEAVFARGDRRLGKLLLKAHEYGCKFDAWSESFKEELWEKAIEDTNTDISFYAHRKRKYDEVMPWDIIDSCVSKAFLISENEKSTPTRDCRDGCVGCGINREIKCELDGVNLR